MDDLTTARWHPSRFRHHFITNYLCKARDKHKPTVPITVCTAFLLDELARNERSIESDVLLRSFDFDSHPTLIIPTKIKPAARRNGSTAGTWVTYFVVRGDSMPARFPSATGENNGTLVIVSVGAQRSVECEREILQLLYRKAALPVAKSCLAYSFVIERPDELCERYLLPNHTRYLDLVESAREWDEWREVWKMIALAEAVLKDPVRTIADILKADGEVTRLAVEDS
ncbi:hypothetical protein TWF696_005520 [Orbilia brochopaga]|uniref:Uncharacterized protein n=1 Tax=Orbilia brochopaga TaxID=3140254 RepID=A0AAV9V2N9_9PEZI